MQTLKFITAGSVDDGKSTLIGRLLYDTDNIFADQLEALNRCNRRNENGDIDLSILTDGLKAEREQGITIDVAYKYFYTPKRKFIMVDAPGHAQYTRNMITGASDCNLAIILIDARKGVLEQTIRHSFIISLLAIPQVVVCINKVDSVGYSDSIFKQVVHQFQILAEKIGIEKVVYIPISAIDGDNVVHKSANMPWYAGNTLLHFLESTAVEFKHTSNKGRLPVQYIIRSETKNLNDYRAYAGRVAQGVFKIGDKVTALPSGLNSTITAIRLFEHSILEATTGQSVAVQLEDQIDISRGNMLVHSDQKPMISKIIEADICWMDTNSLDTSLVYHIQHHGMITRCRIEKILYKIDITTLSKVHHSEFKMNDIGRAIIKTSEPLFFDNYQTNQKNGCAILIDNRSNSTVGALMLRAAEY